MSNLRRRVWLAAAALVATGLLARLQPAAPQETPSTAWVSAPAPASAGAAGGSSTEPAVSADGSVVAFTSTAANLVSPPTEGRSEVFVYDASRPADRRVELASVDDAGGRASAPSSHPSLSGDGRFVAFQSEASLVPEDIDGGLPDVYVRDRLLGRTELASAQVPGRAAIRLASEPSISPDGRYVAMVVTEVTQTRLPPSQVFLHDRVEQTYRLVSHRAGSAGAGWRGSRAPAVSAFGAVVAFLSEYELGEGGRRGRTSAVFAWNAADDSVTLVSAGARGELPNRACGPPSVSDDGSRVLFACLASNLVMGDADLAGDLLLADRRDGSVTSVGAGPGGLEADVCGPASPLRCDARVSISASGTVVAFSSAVAPGAPTVAFARNLESGRVVALAVDPAGQPVTDGSHMSPAIAAVGYRVAFVSTSAALTGGSCRPLPPACTPDVFLRHDQSICPCPPPPGPYPAPVVAAVELDPPVSRQGRVVVARGQGFPADAPVVVSVAGAPVPEVRVTTSPEGTFAAPVVIGRGVQVGSYRLVVRSDSRSTSTELLVVRPSLQPPAPALPSG